MLLVVTASILKNECGVQRFLSRDADLFATVDNRIVLKGVQTRLIM